MMESLITKNQWQLAPTDATPEMCAAAQAAREAGADFAGQYRAAMAAAHPDALASKKRARPGPGGSPEEAEELLESLEGGLSSVEASDLFQAILAGDKRKAIRIIQGERFSKEHAALLYAYCRHKWTGARLQLVEISPKSIVTVVRDLERRAQQNDDSRPSYLLRQGIQVVPCRPYERNELMTFLTSKDEILLKDVQQLWLVTQTPPTS